MIKIRVVICISWSKRSERENLPCSSKYAKVKQNMDTKSFYHMHSKIGTVLPVTVGMRDTSDTTFLASLPVNA